MTKQPTAKSGVSKTNMNRPREPKRFQGMVPLAMPIERVAKPILGKNGFISGALVMDWPAIVGADMAKWTIPTRIIFPKGSRQGGTVTIKVAASAYSTALQHLEPMVIAKVNTYFGYNAVAKLRLVHGPITKAQTKFPTRAAPSVDPVAAGKIDEMIATVDNEELRESLDRLRSRLLAPKA